MVSSPIKNPNRLGRVDQRALIYLLSEIEISKDKLFFINHIDAGSSQAKSYLVQVGDPFYTRCTNTSGKISTTSTETITIHWNKRFGQRLER